jgi:ankyrin repeat protein
MNAEASLAGICIRYLLFDTFRDGPWADKHQILELIQRNPFLAYAAPFWGIHVQKSETDPHIQNLTVDFFRHHNGVAAAHQVTQVLKQRKDIYWYPEECLSLTPLHISSHFGLETMTRILLDQTNLAVDATTNMGTTPLIKAASRGHVLIINMLLQKGADPYLENWYGTAIHCAAEAGHSNTITELIRHGMSPNSCAGVYKRTPLDCTLDNNHAAAFETLIKLEADIYVPNEYGLTVFQEAMRHDCVKIIDLILRRGWADLETLSAEGFPAIHYAVMGQNATTLIKLLDAGADVNARDQHMFTALQLAKQDNSAAGKEIVTLLLARGAIDDLDSNDEGEGNMDVDGGDAEMLVEDLSRQVACP